MQYAWIITLISIIGTIGNIKKQRWCFYVWTFTNFAWMSINVHIKFYPQAFLYLVYFILAVWGIVEWQANKENENNGRKEKNEQQAKR